MVDQPADHQQVREASLIKLAKDIETIVYDSETSRDFNVLALLLMIKSLDILSSQYSEKEVGVVVRSMIADRNERRRVPVTQEYVEKLSSMQRWLG